MKKIEKLQSSDMKTLSGEIICATAPSNLTMMDKINEIIDRLNQEVSQPEGRQDENNWYCECDEPTNKGEHICKNKKVENNTEEWRKKFSNLLMHYIDYDLEEKDLIEFIEQLLSERSFSKEELEVIRKCCGNSMFFYADEVRPVLEKVDRLLSLSK